jgi:hypothetical protein
MSNLEKVALTDCRERVKVTTFARVGKAGRSIP